MDFFDFLFLMVFILIIAVNIAKQLKKTSKPAKPTGRRPAATGTGWKKALNDILKDIREQMEKGAEPPAGKPARGRLSWEDIILPDGKTSEMPGKAPEQRETVKARPKPMPMEAEVIEIKTLGTGKEMPAVQMEDLRLKKARSDAMSRGISQPDMGMMPEDRWSVEDLRNAVIWHEILSPPLGLRDDFRQ